MDNKEVIEVIKVFLKKNSGYVFSINDICDHINSIHLVKKYIPDELVSIINQINPQKKITIYSYLNYNFFEKPATHMDIIRLFILFIIKNYRNNLIWLSCIYFMMILFAPYGIVNFLLLPFIISLTYLVNKLCPIPNFMIMIPIFLGLYPFTYGAFVYSDYIEAEFTFLNFQLLYPDNMRIFDSRIDIHYFNYLIVCVNFLISLMVVILKSIFDKNKNYSIVMGISFFVILFAFVIQKKLLSDYDFFIAFNSKVAFLIMFFYLYAIVIRSKDQYEDFKSNFIYLLFFVTSLLIHYTIDDIVEHYYSSINVLNNDTCSNIDRNFKVIKNSKKIGYVVVDSKSLTFQDILSYLHYNNKLYYNVDFKILPAIYESNEHSIKVYSYKDTVSYYENEILSNSTSDKIINAIKPQNNNTSSIIEHYIKLNPKDRFFYYRCE